MKILSQNVLSTILLSKTFYFFSPENKVQLCNEIDQFLRTWINQVFVARNFNFLQTNRELFLFARSLPVGMRDDIEIHKPCKRDLKVNKHLTLERFAIMIESFVLGDVILDISNNVCQDEDDILDQIYTKQICLYFYYNDSKFS